MARFSGFLSTSDCTNPKPCTSDPSMQCQHLRPKCVFCPCAGHPRGLRKAFESALPRPSPARDLGVRRSADELQGPVARPPISTRLQRLAELLSQPLPGGRRCVRVRVPPPGQPHHDQHSPWSLHLPRDQVAEVHHARLDATLQSPAGRQRHS